MSEGPGDDGRTDRRHRHPEPGVAYDDALRGGAAVYAAGEYHAAHDAWEATWLALEDGPDRDLLQGLIQLSVAVHHARHHNWSGARGLARSARRYLDGLEGDDGPGRRGVAVAPVRAYLATLAADPEVIERRLPVRLLVDGEPVAAEDLRLDALAVAADVVAEEYGDEALIERAVRYAREDVAEGGTSPLVDLLVAYVRDGAPAAVRQRLDDRVRRRRSRERDVEGLFDGDEDRGKASGGDGNDDGDGDASDAG
jgi:hypothetical protein